MGGEHGEAGVRRVGRCEACYGNPAGDPLWGEYNAEEEGGDTL